MDSDDILPTEQSLEKLAREVGERLIGQQGTIALAESCTGGLVAEILTRIPGSSAWVDSGHVVYANRAKEELLQVPAALITQYGAVSEEVARAMATNCRRLRQVTVALSITGIAGPDGGSADKPVGTVCFAWSHLQGVTSTRRRFSGDRQTVRRKAAAFALSTLLTCIPD